MTQADKPVRPVPAAPVAARRPTTRTLWGDVVDDDLAWLRHADDPAVVAHLEAENAYAEAVLAPGDELEAAVFEEIRSRIQETDLSVPVVDGPWAYYTRTVEGLAYPIHCRRPTPSAGDGGTGVDDPAGDGGTGVDDLAGDGGTGVDDLAGDRTGEVVLLDENVEAGASEFFDVGPFDVSPDHRRLYWGADHTGDERYRATIRDLHTGDELDDVLEDVSTSSAWAIDGVTLFYVRPDAANRPYQVWRHTVGTGQTEDVLVFEELDERFFVGVGLERDRSFIQIGVGSKITDEVWVIPADRPAEAPRVLAVRRTGVEYGVAHHGNRFVIVTNERSENFSVVTMADDMSGHEHWTDLEIAPDPSDGDEPVMVMDADPFDDHLVLFERAGGTTRIRVRWWADGSVVTIDQPEAASTVWPGANPDPAATTLRYGYTSMVSPPSVRSIDLITMTHTVLKQQEVLGGFDPEDYLTERWWAEADDGTRVPVTVVARRDRPAGPGPVLLNVYGAYEASMDPGFSVARLSLLERGFLVATGHVRGGGELGRRWYLDGKLEHKANTFDDVVTVAEHLIGRGVTTPDRLVLRGGSAGGLAVGAAMNLRPDLFASVVAQVPFVDVVNTMADTDLPLTITEWEEWGDPVAAEDAYRTIVAYAPYENVRPAPYPSVLATAGLHDTRVGFWEPAKWVQRLREASTSGRPILLLTELEAGHGGPSGRYDAWHEEAKILSYVLRSAGRMA
ncbi:MAG: S9 family peptidase [Acidimicrobiales bacterium]